MTTIVLDANVHECTQGAPIPLGLIAPSSSYEGVNLRGPVLEQIVAFDAGQYRHARRAMFDALPIAGPRMPMLSFVLYVEDMRLHWLADPTEPVVWRAIGAWNKLGAVSIALSREETHTFRIPLPEKLGGPVNLLRHLCNQPANDTFVTQAIEMFEHGLLNSYDHPDAPSLTHKGACLLHTRRVDQALKRLGYEIVQSEDESGIPIYRACKQGVPASTCTPDVAIPTLH